MTFEQSIQKGILVSLIDLCRPVQGRDALTTKIQLDLTQNPPFLSILR